MEKLTIAEKDFDEWAELARTDPSSFEQMRLAAIDRFIENAPEHHRDRLRRLQWRIDQERRISHHPLDACVRLSRMMWERMLGRGGLRDQMESLNASLTGRPVAASVHESVRVLPFVAQKRG